MRWTTWLGRLVEIRDRISRSILSRGSSRDRSSERRTIAGGSGFTSGEYVAATPGSIGLVEDLAVKGDAIYFAASEQIKGLLIDPQQLIGRARQWFKRLFVVGLATPS